jgi:hypothetical protein
MYLFNALFVRKEKKGKIRIAGEEWKRKIVEIWENDHQANYQHYSLPQCKKIFQYCITRIVNR